MYMYIYLYLCLYVFVYIYLYIHVNKYTNPNRLVNTSRLKSAAKCCHSPCHLCQSGSLGAAIAERRILFSGNRGATDALPNSWKAKTLQKLSASNYKGSRAMSKHKGGSQFFSSSPPAT